MSYYVTGRRVLQRQVAREQCSRLYQDCITVSHRQVCPGEEPGY